MIAAPSAAFETEEGRDHNRPFFRFVISPHYFLPGVGAGLGTFVNMTFVSPEKLLVTTGSATASWTSAALRATVGEFPAEADVTYTLNAPGYVAAVEFRTAATAAGLSGASWAAVSDGGTVDLYEYYQWRVTWTGYRCMAEDAEEDADGLTAYAVDTAGDDYDSYASDGTAGDNTAYLDRMRIAGEYPIDQGDILEAGTLSLDVPVDFGSLVAGDHTLVLLNRDGKYSPGHKNFIFYGETYWHRKRLTIEMGYEGPAGPTDTITLYAGIILRWGPVRREIGGDGQLGATVAEVYSRDLIADLGEKRIGRPNSEGDPQPLWFGEYLAEAAALGDRTLTGAQKAVGFEDGSTNELTAVETGGDGAVTVITDDPYAGDYCVKFTATGTGAYGRGRLDLPATAQGTLFTVGLKFAEIPAAPVDKNMCFMELHTGAGSNFLLYVASDFTVWAYHASAGWKETNWVINENNGVWLRVSLALYVAVSGVFKVFVNGDEVLVWEHNWSTNEVLGGRAGISLSAAEAGWELHADSWEMCNDWQPQVWQVPGGPFESIGAVYHNGALQMARPVERVLRPEQSYQVWAPINQGFSTIGQWVPVYVAAETITEESFTRYPQFGAVVFAIDTEVTGSVLFRVRKNSLTHPVDICEALLGEVGADGYADAASFAAARAATPDDAVGCKFQDMTVAEALQSLGKKALLQIVGDHGAVKIAAYTGEAPGAADLVLDESLAVATTPTWPGENIKNKISARYGWFERNNRLRYEASDAQSIAYIGELDKELDLTYGSEVASESAAMVQNKVNALLTRLKMDTVVLEARASLAAARLELGDVVQVESEVLGAAAKYHVFGKRINMMPPRGAELILVRFRGEEV